MFTGIVQAVGAVRSVRRRGAGRRLVVAADLGGDVCTGESVAVDGACLTAVACGADSFEVDVSPQTLERTTLGSLRPVTRVNLERALRGGDRLGGHVVTGHVDGKGLIARRKNHGDFVEVEIEPMESLPGAILARGSVAVDGISLTVASVSAAGFVVTLIPETMESTALADKRVGGMVNLETDMLGKYVEHYLARMVKDDEGKRRFEEISVPRLGALLGAPLREGG